MTWYRVDDNFPDHPKLESLESDPVTHAIAVAAWTLMGADCAKRRTDGRFTEARLRRVLPWPEKMIAKAQNALLSEGCGLWKRDGSALVFHDWEDYQPTKEELDADRRAATERQKRWRKKRRAEQHGPPVDGGVDASTNGVTDAVTNGVSRRANGRGGTPSTARVTVDALVTTPRPVPSHSSPSESGTRAVVSRSELISELASGIVEAYDGEGLPAPRQARQLTWPGWHDLAAWIEDQAAREGADAVQVAQCLVGRFLGSRSAKAKGYPIAFLAANPSEFWRAA